MFEFNWLKPDTNFKKLIEIQSRQNGFKLYPNKDVKKEMPKVKKISKVNYRRNK